MAKEKGLSLFTFREALKSRLYIKVRKESEARNRHGPPRVDLPDLAAQMVILDVVAEVLVTGGR